MINVLRNLGGAGGTIVGKALSACGAYVFSETNPRSATILGHELNALAQLRRLAPAHVPPFWRTIDANTLGSPIVFGGFMREVLDGFAAIGRPVVIRDHSYTDYIGVPFVWPAPERASLDEALDPLGPRRELVVVRHPVATFRSLREHPHYHWCLDGPRFVDGALRFHRAFASARTIRFEAFLADADAVLRVMCDHFGMTYAEDWRARLSLAVLGSGHPRALASGDVRAAQRPDDDWRNHQIEMNRSPHYAALMRASGYEEDPG